MKGQNSGDIGAAQEQFLGARMTVDGIGALFVDLMAQDCDGRSSRQGASMISIDTFADKINTSARGACVEVFA